MNVRVPLRGVLFCGVTAVALAAAFMHVNIAGVARAAASLPAAALVTLAAALVAGTLLSCLRLQLVARDLGAPMRFGDAMAATAAGAIGGALFFSIFGQVLARSAVLAKTGVSPSATIVLTGYERLIAAAVSFLLALGGAIYLFGHVALDLQFGGAELLKLAAGGVAVLVAGFAFAWGADAVAWLRALTVQDVVKLMRVLTVSLSIQGMTMLAYIAAAHSLAPALPLTALASSIAIVMFAASVPISFAGWGVREISAVYALGAIKMPAETAIVTAATIGVFSLLAAGAIAVMGVAFPRSPASRNAAESVALPRSRFDAGRFLNVILPVGAAMAVFFQVEVPVGSGRLNVNLADGVVVFGGALFALQLAHSARAARLSRLALYAAATTLVVALSFLHGWMAFGVTDWALVNRLLGWAFLLAYFGTGALLTASEGAAGFRLVLSSFVAAGLAIVSLELALLAFRFAGYEIPITVLGFRLEGFAGNANAFAFQLLMVMAALLGSSGAAPSRPYAAGEPAAGLTAWTREPWQWLRHLPLALLLNGLVFAGSRAGWIAAAAILATALWQRSLRGRDLAAAAALAAALMFVITGDLARVTLNSFDWVYSLVASGNAPAWSHPMLVTHVIAVIASAPPSDSLEHVQSVVLGLKMWLAHPLFGAGLGAFMDSYTREYGHALVIHSTPVWLLAETGIAGFAVFAAAFVAVLKNELGVRAAPDAVSRVIVLALVGFAVMSAAHDLMYQRSLWLLMGGALLVAKEARRSVRSASVAPGASSGLHAAAMARSAADELVDS